jgi:hypothetical protein
MALSASHASTVTEVTCSCRPALFCLLLWHCVNGGEAENWPCRNARCPREHDALVSLLPCKAILELQQCSSAFSALRHSNHNLREVVQILGEVGMIQNQVHCTSLPGSFLHFRFIRHMDRLTANEMPGICGNFSRHHVSAKFMTTSTKTWCSWTAFLQ